MTVYLVGAGPGDPGLLTLRGRELLERCEALVYDRLADPRIVAMARADAERHDAGKRAGRHTMTQDEINALLVDLGRRLDVVVRLKGGDPFIFGRGGEEALALREAGIAFEVVPGISSAYAVPAYAGIPVTQRGIAAQVTVVTGHEDPTKPESAVDWGHLARTPGTLVFLMGVSALEENMRRLVEHGLEADTPAAVIASGTRPAQQTVVSTAGAVAADAAEAGVRPPAITLVGEVATLHEQIGWFESRPLFGRRVVVTRARAQASGLARRLSDLGAEVVEAPAIRIEPVPFDRPDLGSFDVAVFTSVNGVELVLDGDVRALHGVQVAAIGSATADALRARGVEPDLLPEQAMSESLLEAMGDVHGRRVLLATAQDARRVLPDGLRDGGAEVVELHPYRTVREPVDRDALLGSDLVTFTSSSTVDTVLDGLTGQDAAALRAVSIGPITSRSLRARGVEPVAEADPRDVEGLVQAVLRAAE